MIRSLRTAVQVIELAKRLAPEQRRAVKQALLDLRHKRAIFAPWREL